MRKKKTGSSGFAMTWAIMALLLAVLLTVLVLPVGFSYAKRSARGYSEDQAYLTARSAAEAIAADYAKVQGFLEIYETGSLPTKKYYRDNREIESFIGAGQKWPIETLTFNGHTGSFGELVPGEGTDYKSFVFRSAGDGDNIKIQVTATAGGKTATVLAYLHQYSEAESFDIPDDAALSWTGDGANADPAQRGALTINTALLDPDKVYANYDAANGWLTEVIHYTWVITGYDVG